MFKTNLKTAWRNLTKNKTFSLINIAGLSIGLAACVLILQYVSFELSYDQFNENTPDLYRVYNDRYQNGKLIQHGTITYSAIGKAMQDNFPEVVNHTRVEPFGAAIISYNDKKIGGQESIAVDNSFLSMFNYPLVAGEANTALKEPHCIIITESSANTIFGTRNWSSLLGKLIVIGTDSTPFKITGICQDVPENSHLQFNILISYLTLYTGPHAYREADYDFTDSDFWHYIQLKHGASAKALESKFPAFSDRFFQGNKVSGSVEKFYLQPLSRAHLYSDFEYEIGKTGSASVAWGLLIIAVLIIVIAWVNYINLATAKSVERAKEVGIRKVSGATRLQLVRQFLTESLILNIIALLIAIALVLISQNGFNALVQHNLSLSYLFQKGLNGYSIPASLFTLIISGIVISGFYPAFVLSSFKPILVLKGKFSRSAKGISLRKILVIGQFAITIVLIVGSLVVYKQLKFVSEQDLGMDISKVLIVKSPELTNWDSTFIDRENNFSRELLKLPGVQGAAISGRISGDEMGRVFNIHRSGADAKTNYTMRNNSVGLGFVELYGLKILAGRPFAATDFNPDFSKLHNIILTQSAVKLLGFSSPQSAIGQSIYMWDRNWDMIAVVNDYHQKSLRYPIEPTVLIPAYSPGSAISVKLSSKELTTTIASIRKTYDSFFPGNLFDYFFLDEKFNRLYSEDQLFGKVFALFAGFAIFISCLGLLGLSLYATSQRTKEIGVRKVLGASIANIVLLLSKDFILLIGVAIIIASPVAWLLMHHWLQNFAYRISISWWLFIVAGVLAMAIALLTVGFQAIKSAVANPAKSLRTE